MSTAPARLAGRALLALLLGVAALFATAQPAGAHASVRQTTPFDGERIEAGDVPDVVTIEYNERVEVPPNGIRVLDEGGNRVDTDEPVPAGDAPMVGAVALQDDLGDGSYIVTWRAVSEDGHPIRGAFVFTVGASAAASDTVVADLLSGGGASVAIVQRVATAATYAAVLFLVGALLAGGVLGRAAAGRSVDWVRRAAITAVVLTGLAVPLQAMAASGDGLAAAIDGEQLWTVLASSVGLAAVVRLVGLVGVLLAEGRARQVAGGLTLLSFLVDGHTRTVEPLWLMLAGDALHLVAASVWFGGLVVLVRELRARRLADDPVGGATMLAGWSRLAMWSVAGVVAGGVAMSYATVRTPLALVTSTYGQLLQVKLLLAVIVIGIGAWNHFRLVPRVREAVPVPAGGSTATTPDAEDDTAAASGGDEDARIRTGLAWLRLRRTVRAEVLVLLGILLVTGFLQNERPAADALGIGGTFQVTEELTEDLDLDIVVDPNVAGQNAIHLYLLNEAGRTVSDVEDVRMELSLPEQDIGPIERTPVVSGPGHWVLNGRELALPGTWEITAIMRIDRFTEASVTVPVVVAAE